MPNKTKNQQPKTNSQQEIRDNLFDNAVDKGASKTAKKIKVLVIEDWSSTQKIVAHIFKHDCQDCDLTLADTGEAALSMIQTTKYDIIFTNIYLPDIGGFAVTKKIRSSTINAATPIIAFTALHGYKEQCLAAGMDDFIDKVTPNLRLTIRQMIDKFKPIV